MPGFEVFCHPFLGTNHDGLVAVAILVGHGTVAEIRVVDVGGSAGGGRDRAAGGREGNFIAVPDFGWCAGIGPQEVAGRWAEAAEAAAESAAAAAVFAEGIA